MSVVALRRGFSISGVLSMSLDWVPGVGVAIAGSFLSMWRGSAVLEERVNELKGGQEAFTTRLEKFERDMELMEGSVHGQLSDALRELNGVATQLKVTIAEQNAFNKVNTRTLEGLVSKLEHMVMMSHQHDKDIALLKQHAGLK